MAKHLARAAEGSRGWFWLTASDGFLFLVVGEAWQLSRSATPVGCRGSSRSLVGQWWGIELGSEQEVPLTFKSCSIAIYFYYHSRVRIPHLLAQQTHKPIGTNHSNHTSEQHTWDCAVSRRPSDFIHISFIKCAPLWPEFLSRNKKPISETMASQMSTNPGVGVFYLRLF